MGQAPFLLLGTTPRVGIILSDKLLAAKGKEAIRQLDLDHSSLAILRVRYTS